MRKKIIILSFFVALLICKAEAQQKNTFEIRDGHFWYNNEKTPIVSGEMHYPRIPHQYWRHRMKMLKALGLNAVATYVFWNIHEPQPGQWNFEGDNNLAEYIKIAGEEGLKVILRPGPYVCAEWEFGGYPWWLNTIEGMDIRRDNDAFLERTGIYIRKLYDEVGHLQITKGGPIIMVQGENEFGSYVSQRKDIPLEEHRRYNAKILKQLEDAGFNVPLFTSDGTWLFEGGAVPGALPTGNGESNIERLKKTVNEYHDGKGPYMVAEFYPGWLAHWLEPHPNKAPGPIARKAEEYLQNDVSFNLYMVHGGTNFGFTSGANYNKNHDIQPDLTSYDYNAPISEAGWVTPKYDSLRNVIKKYVSYPVPEPPAPAKVIEIPSIQLSKAIDVLNNLSLFEKVDNEKPLTFEQLNQPYGYVLYEYHFNQPISGELQIPGLRDYALIYIDGTFVGRLNRYYKQYSMNVDIPFNSTLQILVENMGRINYGSQINFNTKGIISPVSIDGNVIEGEWAMYKIPMNTVPSFKANDYITDFDKSAVRRTALANRPVIYQGTFNLTEPGDTFIDMEEWGKGIIFINGHNIGRYWYVGPQQTLFIPGVWLKKGKNDIVIFEQINQDVKTSVSTVKTPVLTKIKPE